MTTGGITEQWVGGKFELLNAGHPKASGVSAATLTYTSGDVTVTLGSISTTALDGRYVLASTLGETTAELGVLYLPGTTGHYASTPDTSALDIVGDIDVRLKIAPDDWTPAAVQVLIAKSVDAGNQISWRLEHMTSGVLRFRWSTDGTGGTLVTADSTAAPGATAGVADGSPLWVRVTLDVDNGSSDADVTFYYSTNGTDWTQLGAVVNPGSTTSIFSGSAGVEIGTRNAGTTSPFTGKVYEAQLYDGIAGTLVYNPIFEHPVTGFTITGINMRDTVGRSTTINGSNWEWRGKA